MAVEKVTSEGTKYILCHEYIKNIYTFIYKLKYLITVNQRLYRKVLKCSIFNCALGQALLFSCVASVQILVGLHFAFCIKTYCCFTS